MELHVSVMLIVILTSGSAEIIYFQYGATKGHLLEASYGHTLHWNLQHSPHQDKQKETKCLEQNGLS